MQTKVSVVMPCFNKVDYIGKTLESICNQRWDNIQLILVNDGAADGSRDVIEEWWPRFLQRGYEVIVIDQENQGICAAVLNGMKRVSGEYFCCIDCDDLLDEEYVSTMANFLDSSVGYEWVCCDFVQRFGTEIMPSTPVAALPSDPYFLENFLLRRTFAMTWIYLFKVSYLQKCKVIEKFITSPRACQEESLLIPVAAGGGNGYYLDKPLYTYVRDGRDSVAEALDRLNKIDPDFFKNQAVHAKLQIEKLNVSVAEKQRLLTLQELGTSMFVAKYALNDPDALKVYQNWNGCVLTDLATQLNNIFSPAREISADLIAKTGVPMLLEAVAGTVLGRTCPAPEVRPGRMIGYGAMGRMAEKQFELFGAYFDNFDELWDTNAKEGDNIKGVPVKNPDFDSLRDGDTILVFPKNKQIIYDVKKNIGTLDITVWGSEDIFLLLSNLCYPLKQPEELAPFGQTIIMENGTHSIRREGN